MPRRKEEGPARAKGEASRDARAKPGRYSAKAVTGTSHRRLQALQGEAMGVRTTYEIVGLDALLKPTLLPILLQVIRQWLLTPPLCLTCDFEFEFADEAPLPPKGFVFVRPWQEPGVHHASISALCKTCAVRPDLNERIVAALKAIWPDACAVRLGAAQ